MLLAILFNAGCKIKQHHVQEIAQDTSQNPTNDTSTVIAMTTNTCYLDHQVSHMISNISCYNRLQIVPPAQVVMTTNESYATPHQDNVDNDYEELS